MLAQVYIRRHMRKVEKLILSTTAVLDAESVSRYRRTMIALESMPPEMVRGIAAEQMFSIIAPQENEHAFYRAYLAELYRYRVNKVAILSTYQCLVDFAENYVLSSRI